MSVRSTRRGRGSGAAQTCGAGRRSRRTMSDRAPGPLRAPFARRAARGAMRGGSRQRAGPASADCASRLRTPEMPPSPHGARIPPMDRLKDSLLELIVETSTNLPPIGRADRDLDGVRKCLLHAVWQAQGQGCSAGAIGAAVGGDRTTGYEHAKKQLFRTLDDVNPEKSLQALEEYILKTSNTLGIGTMGFGGGVTLIGCKVGVINRLPASFFVSVAYDCWAFRRLGVVLDGRTGAIRRWLYKEDTPSPRLAVREGGLPRTGREGTVRPPLDGGQ